MKLTASGMHFRTLNEQIRQSTDNDIEITNCCGQRYIGSGLKNKNITIHGVPGNALASYFDGGTITVHGNAQDATCDTMNDGRVVIYGSCGDAAGYGMRGGQLLIRDNVGYRAGIHMKAYKEQQPLIMVGGMAGSFLAEYQAGGTIIVLGLNNQEKPAPIGALCCAGMHGGRLFLRCNSEPTDFDDHILVRRATPEDMQSIEEHLQDFCETFAVSYNDVMAKDFYVVTPNTSNPYQALYTKNCV